MDLSHQDAVESLETIHDVTRATRRAIAAFGTGPILVLWGLIWIVGFSVLQFSHFWGCWIFLALDLVGIALTAWISFRSARSGPVRSTAISTIGRRIFWFWFAFFLYIDLWLVLMAPFDGFQFGAFIVTAIMFAYVIMGLWLDAPFMIGLGLTVTVLAVTGFYLLKPWFFLWMAAAGGGALFATGLYVRKWRN